MKQKRGRTKTVLADDGGGGSATTGAATGTASFTGSEEMQTFVMQTNMSLYSKDQDGVVTCPGTDRMCMLDFIRVAEVYQDQNKVIRDHLEKALRKARRKWVREMSKAIRRSERDLRLDKRLTSGFVATKEGLFLVLQHHKREPGHALADGRDPHVAHR